MLRIQSRRSETLLGAWFLLSVSLLDGRKRAFQAASSRQNQGYQLPGKGKRGMGARAWQALHGGTWLCATVIAEGPPLKRGQPGL